MKHCGRIGGKGMHSLTEKERDAALEAEKYLESRQQYMARMVKDGFDILVPDTHELFIDIDTEENYQRFLVGIARLQQEFDEPLGKVEYTEKPSKSGLPKRHVIVSLPFDVTPAERIAYQAVLGSDLVREVLSLFRLRWGDPVPTLLAEKRR
jgi:NDP-sugar pyrophosphorylase family protein